MNEVGHYRDSYLIDISSSFADEASQALRGAHNLAAIKPTSLADFQRVRHELGLKEIFPSSLRAKYERIFARRDPKIIAELFPSEREIILAFSPFSSSGVPLEDLNPENYFRIFVVDDGGRSTGFTSYPSYCHRLLPLEIQTQCSFKVKRYKNFPFPSHEVDGDIDKVKEDFFRCFDALKKLLEGN